MEAALPAFSRKTVKTENVQVFKANCNPFYNFVHKIDMIRYLHKTEKETVKIQYSNEGNT